jgi:hypothetical protein
MPTYLPTLNYLFITYLFILQGPAYTYWVKLLLILVTILINSRINNYQIDHMK